jgi:protein-tyrosine phosphatase
MNIFWVETDDARRLAIVPRPRGGDWLEDELARMKGAGVDVLVSMLEPGEAEELGLSRESQLCKAVGILFRSFPIPDRETPQSTVLFFQFVDELRAEIRAGHGIAVHCRASIGRSSLLLAALLTAEGFTPQEAFKRLTKARGVEVPDTPDQVRWVEQFAATRNSAGH